MNPRPSTMPETPPSSSPARRRDLVLALGLCALAGIAFWPVLRWMAGETYAHEQLKQSSFVLLIAGAWIAWERRAALQLSVRLSNSALGWLLSAFVCAAAAHWLGVPALVPVGLVAAAGGAVHLLLGPRAFRRTIPLLAAFGLLVLFVLIFPILDWPLRRMAGVEAAHLLRWLGLAPHLFVTFDPEATLTLGVAGRFYVVATECNGFGLITSSLLLGTILLLHRRAPAWRFPGLLPLCVAVGFGFNLLRIATIVLLAPTFPNHYTALHETAGYIALYAGLGLVWFLTGRSKPAPADPIATPEPPPSPLTPA